MIDLTDDLGRKLELAATPERIVSLVPSITETLFAFGVGERIVGITDYCIHPADEVQNKTKLGGTKNVDVDKILSLQPELVIANVEENRKHHVEKLWNAGIPVFVTYPRDVDGCVKMMQDIAALTGAERAAGPIVDEIQMARRQARLHYREPHPRVLCPIWKHPYMTVNCDTFVNSVIQEAGGDNIFAEEAERYPKFSFEEAARRAPEVIFLPTEPYHFMEADKLEFESLGEQVPAIRARRVHIVEGELLTWPSPRLARALREISQLLHH